jgi:hypothetical protein
MSGRERTTPRHFRQALVGFASGNQRRRHTAHRFRHAIVVDIHARNDPINVGFRIVADLEIACLAIENGSCAATLTENSVRTAAPRAALVLFGVRAFRIAEPTLSVLFNPMCHDHGRILVKDATPERIRPKAM